MPLDRAVRRKLLELSAGNPLELVELPTALSDAQLQGIDELGEPIPVNGGIERTFGARRCAQLFFISTAVTESNSSCAGASPPSDL